MNNLIRPNYFSLTLFWFLISLNSSAQNQIAAFLKSASQDQALELYVAQEKYLNKGLYRLSPVRGVELRTQNNRLGSGQQEYGFRINPANPWEIKYTNRVFKTQQATLTLQKELAYKEALKNRYLLANDLLYVNAMQLIRQNLIQNTQNQIFALEQQKSSSFFDAEDYVELKLKQLEEQADLEAFTFEKAGKENHLENYFPGGKVNSLIWSYNEIISLTRLEKVIDSLLTAPLFSTRLAYRQEKIKLADYEYALQKANINPGFIQTEYVPHRFSESKNPMGVSIGINLPLFNPNKADMAEKKLDILEAQNQLLQERKKAEEEIKILVEALKNGLERYKSLEQKLKSFNLQETFAAVNALTKSNPMVPLKFNGQLLKLQKVQLQLRKEIYENYIKLLAAADLINQKPGTNFFHPGLQPL